MDFKKFYDEHSEYEARRSEENENYHEYIQEINFKTEQLLRVIDRDRKSGSILEVGCANGILIDSISNKLNIKDEIFGIDISEKNIQDAIQRFPHINFFEGTIESFIESQSKVFDLVILSDIIEHVPNDLGFLKQTSKIAKQVVINLPLKKSYNNRNRNYGESDTSGHLRCYSFEDGVNLIKKAGFKIVSFNRVISIRDNKGLFDIYKEKQKNRLKTKPVAKRLFWNTFYYIKDNILLNSNFIYRRLYGENIYCLVEKV